MNHAEPLDAVRVPQSVPLRHKHEQEALVWVIEAVWPASSKLDPKAQGGLAALGKLIAEQVAASHDGEVLGLGEGKV